MGTHALAGVKNAVERENKRAEYSTRTEGSIICCLFERRSDLLQSRSAPDVMEAPSHIYGVWWAEAEDRI